MASWKEGDQVKIVTRDVTADDRKTGRYFDHMAGITGMVTNVYGPDEVAVRMDPTSIGAIAKDVHIEAVRRMREKFNSKVSEEGKSMLSPEELNFSANYVLLVRSADLQKA